MSETNRIPDLLEAGIKAESLRQSAIAGNIANLQTPNYRRFDIDFEHTLDNALKSHGENDLAEMQPELYRPMNTPIKSNGNDVSLETEVGEMVKNTLRYKTYIRLLSNKYKQIELAISTNRV